MCEVCSKMVLTHNIKSHMKNHEAKQLFCPKCPRVFRWKSSMTSHLKSAHGDQIKSVMSACEFCGKQFKDKSNLRQHRFSHTGGPYSCKTCGRGFGRKDLLKSHQSKCLVTSGTGIGVANQILFHHNSAWDVIYLWPDQIKSVMSACKFAEKSPIEMLGHIRNLYWCGQSNSFIRVQHEV